MQLNIKRLDEGIPVPSYAKAGDAGFDLRATREFTIYPGETVMVGTGIAVEIPEGYNGEVRPRSGIASRRGLAPINAPGTIDSGYRGEIMVPLHNFNAPVRIGYSSDTGDPCVAFATDAGQLVKRGERIAQLVITPCVQAEFSEVADLADTERGADGFGSSGAM